MSVSGSVLSQRQEQQQQQQQQLLQSLCGPEFKIMGLYNGFCKRFFAAVVIRLTAQSDSRAHDSQGKKCT